ncbi:MAG: LUD domain-containing protein [Ginsengibacter sp.]
MNSRDKILETIANNKPAPAPLPEINIDALQDSSALMQQFKNILQSIGATVINADNIQTVKSDLQTGVANGLQIINTIDVLGSINNEVTVTSGAVFLESVDIAYIAGTLGVAENGAIWLEESKIINRLLPFICQHLVIVLDPVKIVANMHEAYQQITIDKEGYGVFLAGPSKTADIEQSLVIGAHGAKSVKVFLVNQP